MLTVDHVHSYYGSIAALKGVSLKVEQGSIVTLIGCNGAGKTTLLMTICGNPHAKKGTISFQGQDITHMQTHEIARLGIAHVPEGRRIFPKLTVLENLQLGSILAPKAHFNTNLEQVYDLFPILKQRQSQRGGTLSGGEQQMLAIGRALMSEPKLLLLDEPSLGLAPKIVKQIFQIIQEINTKHGVTVVLVEQNAFHALKLADQAYVLVTGNITLSGKGTDLLANPEVRAAYLEGGVE